MRITKGQATAQVTMIAILLSSFGCGSSSNTTASEDSSASGAAAGVAGGALSGSSSSGTQAFLMPKGTNTLYSHLLNNLNLFTDAFAGTACPTFKTTGTGCTASGSNMWLSYSSCNFGSSSASWTGTQGIFDSSGTASCGAFPSPGTSGTLTRQFVSAASSTTPSTAIVTSSFGTSATIDNSTANLGNFNNDTISAILNGGYGEQVTFTSGARSGITLSERIYVTGSFDHSISGSLTITETAGASSRTLSGTVKVYHNLLKVIGTSTFNSVTHADGCCFPTGGNISTVFAAGSNVSPTSAGSSMVGKTETLTFSSTCGSATFVNTSGSSTSVTLSRCL